MQGFFNLDSLTALASKYTTTRKQLSKRLCAPDYFYFDVQNGQYRSKQSQQKSSTGCPIDLTARSAPCYNAITVQPFKPGIPMSEQLNKAAAAAESQLQQVYASTFVQAFNKLASEVGIDQITTDADMQAAAHVLGQLKTANVVKAEPKQNLLSKLAGYSNPAATAQSFENNLVSHMAKTASEDRALLGALIDIEVASNAAA